MAEVSQRLGNGAYRLTVLKTSHSRAVCTGGCLSINCASGHCKVQDEPTQDLNVQSLSKSRVTRRKSQKLSRVRKTEKQEKDVTLRCASYFGPASPRLTGRAETRDSLQGCSTTLYLCAGLPQEKLLSCRMSPWTRRAVFIHPDTFTCPQQVRAVCTVVFILAEQGSERPGCRSRLKALKFHPDASKVSKTTTRGYSFKSEELPLLHKSRTAYYDILKVTPSATQSQIKTAYYKQSFIYHPDKNPGNKEATQRFSEISEAYTILGNISLRRKYDRGILNQSDIQNAGRPSSKDTSSKSTKSQQQQQQRARQFSKVGGKPMFDFDAFYQAHYGEQLQREREMRARKQRMEEMQKKNQSRWRDQKVMELALTMALAMAGLIFVSLTKP